MWIFCEEGFFSVVEVDEREGAPWGCEEQGTRVMVRARSGEQLLTLLECHPVIGDAVVFTSRYSDYPARVVVEKDRWRRVMDALIDGVTYHNFKTHVAEHSPLRESLEPYVRALHLVWSLMARAFIWLLVENEWGEEYDDDL